MFYGFFSVRVGLLCLLVSSFVGFVLIGTLCLTNRFVYAFVLLSDVGLVLIEGLCSLD